MSLWALRAAWFFCGVGIGACAFLATAAKVPRWVAWPLALALAFALPALAYASDIRIPTRAAQYQALLTREARITFGLNAPVATLAAQIHRESAWRADAVSRAGAQGLAQFMPGTARWLPTVSPRTGTPLPFSPSWSIRAMVEYDRWLLDRIFAATPCDRWAMALSAYNGGLGWLRRDRALAASYGLNQNSWAQVRLINAGRSAANFKENRGYPDRILNRWTPVYRAAGWGQGACDVD